MFTAALPVSAPFEVSRPIQPLVSGLGHRKTIKDGTSGERGSFVNSVPGWSRLEPAYSL